MTPPKPVIHDSVKRRFEEEAGKVLSRIRAALILWRDENGDVIAETVLDCRPGDQITVTVPKPGDVRVR